MGTYVLEEHTATSFGVVMTAQHHQDKNISDFRTEHLFSLSIRARCIDLHEDTGLGEDPRVFTYNHLLNSSRGGSLLLRTLRC
jgi:hypothetical protein